MLRPRWHDAMMVSAIVGLLAVGVWALWWDDVRGALGIGPKEEPPMTAPVPTANSQT